MHTALLNQTCQHGLVYKHVDADGMWTILQPLSLSQSAAAVLTAHAVDNVA